jgi:hypothetical protein
VEVADHEEEDSGHDGEREPDIHADIDISAATQQHDDDEDFEFEPEPEPEADQDHSPAEAPVWVSGVTKDVADGNLLNGTLGADTRQTRKRANEGKEEEKDGTPVLDIDENKKQDAVEVGAMEVDAPSERKRLRQTGTSSKPVPLSVAEGADEDEEGSSPEVSPMSSPLKGKSVAPASKGTSKSKLPATAPPALVTISNPSPTTTKATAPALGKQRGGQGLTGEGQTHSKAPFRFPGLPPFQSFLPQALTISPNNPIHTSLSPLTIDRTPPKIDFVTIREGSRSRSSRASSIGGRSVRSRRRSSFAPSSSVASFNTAMGFGGGVSGRRERASLPSRLGKKKVHEELFGPSPPSQLSRGPGQDQRQGQEGSSSPVYYSSPLARARAGFSQAQRSVLGSGFGAATSISMGRERSPLSTQPTQTQTRHNAAGSSPLFTQPTQASQVQLQNTDAQSLAMALLNNATQAAVAILGQQQGQQQPILSFPGSRGVSTTVVRQREREQSPLFTQLETQGSIVPATQSQPGSHPRGYDQAQVYSSPLLHQHPPRRPELRLSFLPSASQSQSQSNRQNRDSISKPHRIRSSQISTSSPSPARRRFSPTRIIEDSKEEYKYMKEEEPYVPPGGSKAARILRRQLREKGREREERERAHESEKGGLGGYERVREEKVDLYEMQRSHGQDHHIGSGSGSGSGSGTMVYPYQKSYHHHQEQQRSPLSPFHRKQSQVTEIDADYILGLLKNASSSTQSDVQETLENVYGHHGDGDESREVDKRALDWVLGLASRVCEDVLILNANDLGSRSETERVDTDV